MGYATSRAATVTPEGRVKSLVKKALRTLPRKYAFMPVQMGMGAPTLDWLCCIAGAFIAIESKVPGKHLTDRQVMTANEIVDAGGAVYVIREQNDVDQMMRDLTRGHVISAIYDTLPPVA